MKMKWLLLFAICLVFAESLFAQDPRLIANVPFDFMVNDVLLPRGEYVVSTFPDGRRLVIQNRDQPEYAAYLFNIELSSGEYVDHAHLTFTVSDGQHMLHQIACTGDGHIHDIVHQGSDPIKLVASR